MPQATPVPAAYYATGTAGWRAFWSLLHPPYTLMHLSFVGVGAALAPSLDLHRFGFTILAFALGMGLGAHALDELNGRPLQTRIQSTILVTLAVSSILLAAVIGVWGAFHYDLLPGLALVAVGVFLVVAYNLELWHGAVHTDVGFATAWGVFPVLVAYYAQTGRLDLVAFAGAAYAFAASLMQRHLSTPARRLRRRSEHIEGHITYADGTVEALDRQALLRTPERALRGLVLTTTLIAVVLLLQHRPT